MKQQWTGERLETFITDETMLEHLHRYAIAMEYVKGKKVLDIACGEGYGANLLAKNAAHVTGVDIDEDTIAKASIKYSAGNVSFKNGSTYNIPFDKNSFDVITCFETIEHLNDHPQLISELKRVLTPEGILFISTPEKLNYSDKAGYKNPFHLKELYEEEFKTLLQRNFLSTAFFRQSSFTGSLLIHEKENALNKIYSGNYEALQILSNIPVMYWLGICSDNSFSSPGSSVFNNSKTIADIQEDQIKAVHKTITYRTGNFLLSPIKFIHSLFKK